MNIKRKKPELLVPASSLEVLKVAVDFGADAVYIGGELFSLRAKAKNFSYDDMKAGIEYAHAKGRLVYVTMNITAHNEDIDGIREYISQLNSLMPDAVIISDPGVFSLATEALDKRIAIHISTQANNVNYLTFDFWRRQGAKRVVTGRELSLKEIEEIRKHIPDDFEIETFIHGAMCISYSGRCLLSNYMTGRDANKGECTHPCRWKYTLYSDSNSAGGDRNSDGSEKALGDSRGEEKEQREIDGLYLEEENRPGEYFPVYENDRGTYIFNSKDLCMIEHIPELISAGIDSFKIEGRMKTALYVATVARTYRKAIDDYFESEETYRQNMAWYKNEIAKCTYRNFTTGFFFGKPGEDAQVYDNNVYCRNYIYLGIVEELCEDGSIRLTQRNKFSVGETVEIMTPDFKNIEAEVVRMENSEGESMDSCPHPLQEIRVWLDKNAQKGDIIRIKDRQA